MQLGKISVHTARKQYRCSQCDNPIRPGTRYLKQIHLEKNGEGSPITVVRSHSYSGCVLEELEALRGPHWRLTEAGLDALIDRADNKDHRLG